MERNKASNVCVIKYLRYLCLIWVWTLNDNCDGTKINVVNTWRIRQELSASQRKE